MKDIEEFVKQKYIIEALVGHGATSKVYKVRRNGEVYALKVSVNKELLKREADFLKNASCNVVPKFCDYMERNLAYLVTEFIEGCDLQKIMDRGEVFTLDEALWILEMVLQGIDYLHQCEPYIVYRDLKPANILVETNGKVWLTDFGCIYSEEMKDTAGGRAGTYGYAAPEQFWENMKPTQDWDVYAAGKVLGYLLTGKNPAIPPYRVEDFWEGNKRIPVAFREVLQRCISENREARYENARELLRALKLAKEDTCKKKQRRQKEIKYKKCIWLSEYRRIF